MTSRSPATERKDLGRVGQVGGPLGRRIHPLIPCHSEVTGNPIKGDLHTRPRDLRKSILDCMHEQVG